MAIQTTLQSPVRILSAVLWQLSKNGLRYLSATSTHLGHASSDFLSYSGQPASLPVDHPSHPHALSSQLHRSEHHPSPDPTPSFEAAASTALLPFRCHAKLLPPKAACPWLCSLNLHLPACKLHIAPWRPGFAASVSVHAKRHPQPAVGPEDAATTVGADERGGGNVGKSASRPKADPVKEMHLKPRIAEHDLSYKLRQMEGWLADGIRTKLVVEFRAAEQSEVAAALLDSLVTRLAGKGQPLGPRQQNKDSWFVTLRPPTAKQSKQQQQAKPKPPPRQQQLQLQPQPQKEEEGEGGKTREQHRKGQLTGDDIRTRGAPSAAA